MQRFISTAVLNFIYALCGLVRPLITLLPFKTKWPWIQKAGQDQFYKQCIISVKGGTEMLCFQWRGNISTHFDCCLKWRSIFEKLLIKYQTKGGTEMLCFQWRGNINTNFDCCLKWRSIFEQLMIKYHTNNHL